MKRTSIHVAFASTLMLAQACASPANSCTVDETLLAQRVDCVDDDDCPCGSYCGSGICEYDCRAEGDCTSGESCDRFGRCVGTERAIGSVLTSPGAEMRVDQTPVRLEPGHPQGVIAITATGTMSGPLRAVATGDITLRCPEGSVRVSPTECVFASVSPDAPTTVGVEATTPTMETVGVVTITGGGTSTTIPVSVGPSAAPVAVPLEGVWEGTAYLVSAGSVARTSVATAPPSLTTVGFPVSASIFTETAGRRAIVLADQDGIVFPDASTVGEMLRASDGAYRIQHAMRPFVTGTGSDAAMLVASAETSEVEVNAGYLAMTLRTSYAGATTTTFTPVVDWRITLRRTGDLPTGATAPTPPTPALPADIAVRAGDEVALETLGNMQLGALVTVTDPARRTQRAMCSGTAGRVLGRTIDAASWSGDVRCVDDTPALNVAPGPARIFGTYGSTTFDINSAIPNCVNDLAQMSAVNAGRTPSALRGCIDAPRLAVALSAGLSVDRDRALSLASTPDPVASALGHRLVQQWVEMLAFVATQSVQIDRLNDIVGGGSTRAYSQNAMLADTLAGWDLLLHPRYAAGLAAMPGPVLAQADYRRRLLSPAVTDIPPVGYHDQGVGLSVAMISALARSLDANTALLDRARYVTADLAELERLNMALSRRSLVLYAIASFLHDQAAASAGAALPWEPQFQSASSAFGAAFGHLRAGLELARLGGNPLGIDDALDLPLYRVGDEVTPLERFSAITDYLVGTGGSGDSSPVGMSIVAAETALAQARASYSGSLERDFQEETGESLSQRRIAAVALGYGGDLQSLCGDPELDLDAVVSGEEDVDPETCWIRPDCIRTGDEELTTLSPGQVARSLCWARTLAVAAPSALGSLADIARSIPTAVDALIDGSTTVRGHSIEPSAIAITMADGSIVRVARDVFSPPAPDPYQPGTPLSADDQSRIDALCSTVANASEAVRPGAPPSSCALHGECPSGYLCTSGACMPDVGTDEEPACYRGYVGELVVALRGNVTDVEIARSEYSDIMRTYDLHMQQCTALISSNDMREAAIRSHNETMHNLASAKLAMDVAAHAAEALRDCSSAPTEDILFGDGIVTCVAATAVAAFNSVSDGLQFAMDEADRAHEATLDMIESQLSERTCLLEAEADLVGLHTQELQVRRSVEDVGAALVGIENSKNAIRATLSSGRAEYQREQDDAVPPIEFDYWLNESTTRYDAAFRRARRAMYLGVLALEYEYQLSTMERTAVLSARTVADLRDSLTRLRNLAATGTIGGAAPSPLLAVVSLRDELLSLADRSDGPEGYQNLTDIERFRLLLASRRFATYDEDGRYTGQEIPFRIAPAALGGNEAGTIAILGAQDCAERIWSMNSSILGEAVLRGSDTTRTRITVRKRNSFFSQLCSGATEERPFQYAATRPSVDLFLDPLTDYAPTGITPVGTSFAALHDADAYANARLQPVVGVTQAQLEDDTYFNGSSRELAGRGLYGDYILSIPAESLTVTGGTGLDLTRVDDILLRFDYVSVTRRR